MTQVRYCLDTHALIWYFTGSSTLSLKAFGILEEIFEGKAQGIIPSLAILEALHLSYKNKTFNFVKFLDALRITSITIYPFDKDVLMESIILPRKLNIHDRVVVATATVNYCQLVSKDKVIRSIKGLKTIW